MTPDGLLAIYDLYSQAVTRQHVPEYDIGGRRVALSSDGSFVVVAAYHRHGLAVRDASGSVLWQRRDIKKTQNVVWSMTDQVIYCCVEKRGCFLLAASDGNELGRWRGVQRNFVGAGNKIIRTTSKHIELTSDNGESLAKTPLVTFAALWAEFGDGTVAISESGGPVRFFSSTNLRVIAEYIPPKGHHVLTLGFSPAEGIYRGVEWEYAERGEATLLEFGRSDYSVKRRMKLSSSRAQFCLAGTHLVLDNGALVNVHGQTVRQMWPEDGAPNSR